MPRKRLVDELVDAMSELGLDVDYEETIWRFDRLVVVVERLGHRDMGPKKYLRALLSAETREEREKYMRMLERSLKRHGYTIHEELRELLVSGAYP